MFLPPNLKSTKSIDLMLYLSFSKLTLIVISLSKPNKTPPIVTSIPLPSSPSKMETFCNNSLLAKCKKSFSPMILPSSETPNNLVIGAKNLVNFS